MLKELLPGSRSFTVAIFKIPQISKHFSALRLQGSESSGSQTLPRGILQ